MNLLLLIALLGFAPQWTLQSSGTTARLRGLSAVNRNIVWASGSNSTVLRTTDGGANWLKLTITSDKLDFRDIDAFDGKTAYVLAIGTGDASRIYKTIDGGTTWSLQFKNSDPKAFYDAMSFWDVNHGIVIGDSIDGQFCILTTSDGGHSWNRVPNNSLPAALPDEGAFAASGSNIAIVGSRAWIATGGAAKSRVLHTRDRGRTWTIVETPLAAASTVGAFSIAFRDARHGIVVGGDYAKEQDAKDNLALTEDGGMTWKTAQGLSGYRSVVAYLPGPRGKTRSIVAIGPAGSDYSTDDGRTWKRIEGPGFDTLSFVSRPGAGEVVGWAAGKDGTIGKLTFR